MLSYIEISKEQLLHNYEQFRQYISPKTSIMSIVKGNAYGHGLKEVASILDPVTDYFGVFDIEELTELRSVSHKPVLILGYVEKESMQQAVEMDARLTVFDEEQLQALNEIGKRGKKPLIHIKIDAALGRQGILLKDLNTFIGKLKQYQNVQVEGIFAHFANIEDTSDFTHAQKQIDIFNAAIELIKAAGFTDIKTHISSSAGTMVYEQHKGISNIVRTGISLYGMWPSEDLQKRFQKTSFSLKPALRWVSHVTQVRSLPPHSSIGYGLTYITSKETKTAIIPQGYSDGYDRGLSNSGEILIHGTRCKVLGRVMMNMIVVDVSHLGNVQTGDEAILLGAQRGEIITAEELAAKIGTINYEITTRINPLLERVIS